MNHPLAGTLAREEDLIDITALLEAYYVNVPDTNEKSQRVSFGTSGHRGKALDASFTDAHVAAITQAICDGRERFGAKGLCLVGPDTHALSSAAYDTVLEVLAGNGVVAGCDANEDFVPTPSISRAILRENGKAKAKELVDGIVITPSHNPPEYGGIKYNPPHGGPAEEEITSWIEGRANVYLEARGEGIKRIPLGEITADLRQAYEFKKLYVEELKDIIDIEAIKKANLKVLINALGGSGGAYWRAIADYYELALDIINDDYDPTFAFMYYDHDGAIRMDCSSKFAMAGVIEGIGAYDLAVGNDPDYDRYGVVTKEGLMQANHFLCVACDYLFSSRSWAGKGIGKTVVVTDLLNRIAQDKGVAVYEVPVGFKYFSALLYKGQVGLVGEESAGGSFLTKAGTVWTTDKDGIIMALLAMEVMAVTGKSPSVYYDGLASRFGAPATGRFEAACTKGEKEKLKNLSPEIIADKEVNGDPILDIRTTALMDKLPIGGLRITTKEGWLVARPSGTEDLYKVYGESFLGDEVLKGFLEAGKLLVSRALEED